jgi:hypothetical protein
MADASLMSREPPRAAPQPLVPLWFSLTSRELAERSAMPGVRRITATLLALMCTDQLIRSRDDEDFRGEPAALVRDGSPAGLPWP